MKWLNKGVIHFSLHADKGGSRIEFGTRGFRGLSEKLSERLIYQKENKKAEPHSKRFRMFDIIISRDSAGSDLDTAS